MRIIYSVLFYLSLPALFLRLCWRSLKSPEYRLRWHERLAIYPSQVADPVVWFHAVSVGEVESLVSLTDQLLGQFPQQRILITCTTPTGSARVKSVFQDRVAHVYLPYDVPDAVDRFVRHFRPRLAVVMETEIWPNLFAACANNAIPLYLINARLTEKSVRGYRKVPSLIRPALGCCQLIAAQSRQDAERFLSIGAKQSAVVNEGNIKFDVAIPPGMIEQGRRLKDSLFGGRFVCLLASTHEGEEAQFIESYRKLKLRIPEFLLVVVPRHPERFDGVKHLFLRAGLNVAARSAGQACHTGIDVYLADSMGELKLFYAAADVAFVGGSLVPVGGHNVLEPAAIGVPVIVGPWMDNFKQVTAGILGKNAAVQCQNAQAVADKIYDLYANEDIRLALIENGRAFVSENRGATEKLVGLLSKHFAQG